MDLLKKYIDYAAMESKELRDLVSSDISKPSDPSPPSPNKIESWANWVEMSAFLVTTLLGGGGWGSGGTTDEPKADKKLSYGAKLNVKFPWRVFSHTPKFFCFPSIVVVVLIRNLKSAET